MDRNDPEHTETQQQQHQADGNNGKPSLKVSPRATVQTGKPSVRVGESMVVENVKVATETETEDDDDETDARMVIDDGARSSDSAPSAEDVKPNGSGAVVPGKRKLTAINDSNSDEEDFAGFENDDGSGEIPL